MAAKIFEELGINTDAVLLVLLILVIVYTVLVIYWLIQSRKVFKRYEIFMHGKDAETLEDAIAELIDRVESLEEQDKAGKDVLRIINRNQVNTFQKSGVVKYNAFEGMGGQASFVLTLLDLNNNGFLLNVIHSRNACYTYLKEIHDGQADVVLGAEERASLMQAMKKKDRFFNPDENILE